MFPGATVSDAWVGKKDIDLEVDDTMRLKLAKAFSGYSDYDDEYDDSFDGVGIGVADNGGAAGDLAPILIRRNQNHLVGEKGKKVKGVRYTIGEAILVESSDEEETGEEGESESKLSSSRLPSRSEASSTTGRGSNRGGRSERGKNS